MNLIAIILNREEYLETILSAFAELEVMDVTFFDGERLGMFLAHQVPIFAGLRQMVGEKKSLCKIVIALLEKRELLDKFVNLLREENIDFSTDNIGSIIVLPVNEVIRSSDTL